MKGNYRKSMMILFFRLDKSKITLSFYLTVLFILLFTQSLIADNCTNYKFKLNELALIPYHQEKDISKIGLRKYRIKELKVDKIISSDTVRPQKNGNLHLTAEKGRAFGSNIEYMEKWEAFGYFNSGDQVEWNVKIEKTGSYEVYLEWSVSNKEAGKPFLLEVENEKITGKVEKTGSWQSFRTEKIGQLNLSSGFHKMIFKSASEFEGALLDLKEIWLIPVE